MDIIFNCPKCDQELAVDNSGAGSEIDCPSCGETIVIPAESSALPDAPPPPSVLPPGDLRALNAIASSAAAKVEMHLKVPTSEKPSASLIGKASKPFEIAAKESDRRIRVKTIRHTDCIEVGHDKFDETVTEFLNKVGQEHIISITPLTYTYLDIGSQKLLTEYAVFVVYKG